MLSPSLHRQTTDTRVSHSHLKRVRFGHDPSSSDPQTTPTRNTEPSSDSLELRHTQGKSAKPAADEASSIEDDSLYEDAFETPQDMADALSKALNKAIEQPGKQKNLESDISVLSTPANERKGKATAFSTTPAESSESGATHHAALPVPPGNHSRALSSQATLLASKPASVLNSSPSEETRHTESRPEPPHLPPAAEESTATAQNEEEPTDPAPRNPRQISFHPQNNASDPVMLRPLRRVSRTGTIQSINGPDDVSKKPDGLVIATFLSAMGFVGSGIIGLASCESVKDKCTSADVTSQSFNLLGGLFGVATAGVLWLKRYRYMMKKAQEGQLSRTNSGSGVV